MYRAPGPASATAVNGANHPAGGNLRMPPAAVFVNLPTMHKQAVLLAQAYRGR